MTRTADIARETKETNVALTLGLDGTGAGTRTTGVGFLDHMLDLLARHGRFDLDVTVRGDLETGAHHTVEDTGIVFGQALDRALGDRAGITRYGAATVPMDEARASCAIDISGRPYCSFAAQLPPGGTGGFDHELAEEFFRARGQRGAHDHPHRRRGRHQRPPHDRGGLQGLRPRAARGGRHRPDRDGRPLDQGDPDAVTPSIGIVDHGMGNRRSVEKALERVGARVVLTADHDALRAADGLVVPGVGAFAAAMRAMRELGLDELVIERAGEGTPVLGLCLGMQLLFDASTELGGDRGLGLLPGQVVALEPGALKIPHIGWNEVAFTRPSPLLEGLGERAAFYHVHSFVARPDEDGDVLGRGDYGGPFTSIVGRGDVYGVQFHPEKSSAAGLALLANFTSVCARVAA